MPASMEWCKNTIFDAKQARWGWNKQSTDSSPPRPFIPIATGLTRKPPQLCQNLQMQIPGKMLIKSQAAQNRQCGPLPVIAGLLYSLWMGQNVTASRGILAKMSTRVPSKTAGPLNGLPCTCRNPSQFTTQPLTTKNALLLWSTTSNVTEWTLVFGRSLWKEKDLLDEEEGR